MKVEHPFLNKDNLKTIDEAVRILLSILSEQDKDEIKKASKERLHHILLGGTPLSGTTLSSIFGLRKFFKLLKTNQSLMNSCKTFTGIHPLLSIEPNEVPSIIVEALWENLQGLQKFPMRYLKSS